MRAEDGLFIGIHHVTLKNTSMDTGTLANRQSERSKSNATSLPPISQITAGIEKKEKKNRKACPFPRIIRASNPLSWSLEFTRSLHAGHPLGRPSPDPGSVLPAGWKLH